MRKKWAFCLLIPLFLLTEGPSELPSIPPVYAETPTPEVWLGTQLFFDPRLSKGNRLSCASCHKPQLGFTDGLPRARGYNGAYLLRNTPTLLHVDKLGSYDWDGSVAHLEDQILSEIKNPDIMNMDLESLIQKLNHIPGYVQQFQALYGTPVMEIGIARAMAAFQRTLITKPAPIDRYLVGERRAISVTARRGMELFQGKARCALCHKGFDFTDSDFHNIGVPTLPYANESKSFGFRKTKPLLDQDVGRFGVTGQIEDRGAFKTPTLRNITQTGPYMHNGVFKTLEEVLVFYRNGGVRNASLDVEMKPINLTSLEIQDIIDFMETMTGELPKIEKPKLP